MSYIEGLSVDYDNFQLEIPYWEILDQGVTVLWGPSGSGKTTLLRILMGLENPTKPYRWHFNGENLASLSVEKRRLGVVFQNYELFPHMTAEQNIYFAAQSRSIPKEIYLKKLLQLSESLQMNPYLKKVSSVLSGGEKQRVAIARALIGQSRILLLDEPFSALDENLKEESRYLLKKVLHEEKIPAILVTHDSKDVEVLANKITRIEKGSIKEDKSLGSWSSSEN